MYTHPYILQLEKEREREAKEAYRDPALSDAARERGNDLFKAARYAEAVKEYTEAVKRNDKDPKAYTNRAACYVLSVV
jgi:stress-induced-phosphoprotein 1